LISTGWLADSEPVHFECWQEILQTFGLHLDWKTYTEQGIGVSDRILLSLLCQRANPPFDLALLIDEFPRKRDSFRARMLERQAFSADVFGLLPELPEPSSIRYTVSGTLCVPDSTCRGKSVTRDHSNRFAAICI
jgi:hypothetical protein